MNLCYRTISLGLLFFALVSGRASAQDRGPVTIRAIGAPIRPVDPGEVETALFRAINGGRDTLYTQLELALPDGWSILSQPGPGNIPPGSSLNRLIAFHVPQRALPELRPVSVALIDAGGDTLGTAKLVFRVSEHRALRASVLSGPAVVATSSPFRVRFAVMNEGNTHETVDLNVRSSLGQPVHMDENRVRLAPFSATEVVVYVEPDGLVTGRQPHAVLLEARAESADGNVITTEVQTRTDVIPEGWDPTDADPVVPLEVGFIASGSNSDVGRQVALSVPDVPFAGGHVQVGMRGPYMHQSGPFDQQDFYSLSYERANTLVALGDQSFRQTQLTEYGKSGFGAQVSHRSGRVGVTAYAMRTRFRFPDQSQAGLSTSFAVLPALTVRLNGLARREFDDAGLISLDGEWRIGRRSFVQAEVGSGSYAGETGTGIRLQATHADQRSRFDLRFQNSTEAFPGSARGTRLISAFGSQDLGSLFTIDAAYGRTRRAIDFRRTSPTVSGHSRVGGTVRLPRMANFAMTATLSANHRYRSDWASELSRSETYGAGSISVSRFAATGRLSIENGRTSSTSGPSPFTKSDLTIFFRRNNLNISGSWTWERGPRYLYPRSEARSQWGLSADVRWSRSIQTELDLYASTFRDPSIPSSRYANASVEFGLPYGHRLTVRARLVQTSATWGGNTDLFAGFAYSIPVTVPTRVRDTGIFGHVVLAQTGKPVQGALVSMGDHIVLTDRYGKFRFSHAEPGSQITVNPGPEGAGLVVMNPEALILRAESVGPNPIEIALVRGSAVNGRIELASTGSSLLSVAADVSHDPLGGIVIVANDGTGDRVAMTRSDGRFSLDGLAPGVWTLRAAPGSLPEDIIPVTDSVIVRLTAGERVESSLQFRPRAREVRIVGSSSLSIASQESVFQESALAAAQVAPTAATEPPVEPEIAEIPSHEAIPAPAASTAAIAPEPTESTDDEFSTPERTDPAVSENVVSLPAPQTDAPAPLPRPSYRPDGMITPLAADSDGRGFPWWLLLILLLLLAESTRRIRRARIDRRQRNRMSAFRAESRPPIPGAVERQVSLKEPKTPDSQA